MQQNHENSVNENQIILIRQALESVFGILDDSQVHLLLKLVKWIHLKGGEQLIRQGEPSESMYFLIHGRLTAVFEQEDGSIKRLGDITIGQSVGEIGLLTAQDRTASVYATRDAVLIEFHKTAMLEIATHFPGLIMHVTRIVIARATSSYLNQKHVEPNKNIFLLTEDKNPINQQFVELLGKSLEIYGKVAVLHQENLERMTGVPSEMLHPDPEGRINVNLQKAFDQIEESHDYVIFWAKEEDDYWFHVALRQADTIYTVKLAEGAYVTNQKESIIFQPNSYLNLVQKYLVILHPDGSKLPKNTRKFLENRQVSLHHHIRMDRMDDIERVARFITGNAIGLALAGGGAKGISHVGVIEGLKEKGIPIDFFSGTSAGALVAGLAAMDYSVIDLRLKAKEMAKQAPTRRKHMNIFPLVSIMKGRHLDTFLESHYGICDIEDTWINFLCIASDLTEKSKVVFRSGGLAKSIRASIALPGVFPPAVHGNSLLLDGGLLENLPVDTLAEYPVGKIIAVTVHKKKSYELGYTSVPDSWELIKQKFRNRRHRIKVPSISTIMMESIVLSSYSKYNDSLERADVHIQPPLGKIGMLDWDAYERLVEIGKSHTIELLRPEIIQKLHPFCASEQ